MKYCLKITFIPSLIYTFALNSGKKFWNLFHLQPMRDQKVRTTSNILRKA